MAFPGNKDFRIHVVGESFYEDNLYNLCGPATSEMRQFLKMAVLTLEANNPKDRNAVRVEIEGAIVGHLSREDAIWFRRISQAPSGMQFWCEAVIVAWHGAARCDYGVRLEIDPAGLQRL